MGRRGDLRDGDRRRREEPGGRGVPDDREGRVFGDFGSEFDVSELAVRAVADAYTGRGPSTMLTELICDGPGSTRPRRCSSASAGRTRGCGRPRSRTWRPLVLEATERGDLVARTILEQIGSSLGDPPGWWPRRLEMGDVRVRSRVRRQPVPHTEPVHDGSARARRASGRRPGRTGDLNTPPVVGAGLMALELAGPTIGAGASPRLASAAANHFGAFRPAMNLRAAELSYSIRMQSRGTPGTRLPSFIHVSTAR